MPAWPESGTNRHSRAVDGVNDSVKAVLVARWIWVAVDLRVRAGLARRAIPGEEVIWYAKATDLAAVADGICRLRVRL